MTPVSTIFKVTIVLSKEEWNCDAINVKKTPYGIKCVLRHYCYSSGPKLGQGVIIIPCIYHAFSTQLSLPCDTKSKYKYNQPRYGRMFYCK